MLCYCMYFLPIVMRLFENGSLLLLCWEFWKTLVNEKEILFEFIIRLRCSNAIFEFKYYVYFIIKTMKNLLYIMYNFR
jgi:hypothetical protein